MESVTYKASLYYRHPDSLMERRYTQQIDGEVDGNALVASTSIGSDSLQTTPDESREQMKLYGRHRYLHTSNGKMTMIEPTPIDERKGIRIVEHVTSPPKDLLLYRDELLSMLLPNPGISNTVKSDGEYRKCHDNEYRIDSTTTTGAASTMGVHTKIKLRNTESTSNNQSDRKRYRRFQSEVWYERFNELAEYKKEHGNCLVPYEWKPNPKLAQWVKRQRYQYKLMKRGLHSTLSLHRYRMLEGIDFVWDVYQHTHAKQEQQDR